MMTAKQMMKVMEKKLESMSAEETAKLAGELLYKLDCDGDNASALRIALAGDWESWGIALLTECE